VDRLNGYLRALAEAGLEHGDDLVRFWDFTTKSGRELTAELLAGRPDIDGLFVAGQLMSYGALRALREAGRRVPTDVAVVGFDDLPGAESTNPPLTSIDQPVGADRPGAGPAADRGDLGRNPVPQASHPRHRASRAREQPVRPGVTRPPAR